jgi:hypothetical protein
MNSLIFFLFLFRSWTRILSSSIWKKKNLNSRSVTMERPVEEITSLWFFLSPNYIFIFSIFLCKNISRMSLSPTYIFLTDFSLTLWGLVFFFPRMWSARNRLCVTLRIIRDFRGAGRRKKKRILHTHKFQGKNDSSPSIIHQRFPGVLGKNKIK